MLSTLPASFAAYLGADMNASRLITAERGSYGDGFPPCGA